MSGEQKPDLVIPIDWPEYIKCEKCGGKIKRGIANYAEHFFNCNGQITEDADFEIIEPKQLPEP